MGILMKEHKQRIVIIGDSFTQGVGDELRGGWTSVFKETFDNKYDILIKGYGGNNICDVLARLYKDLIYFSPNIVILQVGINDSRLRKSLNFSNEVDEKRFEKGLKKFVDEIRAALKQEIYFILIGTTPVIDELTTPYKEDKYYSTIESKKFDEIIRKFCESQGILFIDVFDKFAEYSDLRDILIDGVHPNSKGHNIIANTVISKFKGVILHRQKKF